MQRLLSILIYALTGLIGLAAFASPFMQAVSGGDGGDGVVLTAVLLTLSLAILLLEVQGAAVNAKTVAALGVMVAMTAVLRFIEVAIPGPGGFSPIFVPIILGGYVFGARFGFLLGTMTLFTSALLTGGVGPWLPYQMFAAGWVGLTAGILKRVASGERRVASGIASPELVEGRAADGKRTIIMLAAFGFGWGLLYGAIMNVYFWPFVTGFQPAASVGDGIRRYATYYLLTSLWWDLGRAIGNAALLLLVGGAAIRVLGRFNGRLQFKVASGEWRVASEPTQTRTPAHPQTRTLATRPTRHSPYSPLAWLTWVLAAAVVAMMVRNPLYSVLLIAVFRLVGQACARPNAGFRLPFWRITAVILLFSTLFNAFSVHIGQTVLFTLPAAWPIIGGDITLEAAAFGFSNGLLLLALMAAFLAFNTAVSLSDLTRLTPRALHDMGMVVLIAITYLPETHRHLQRIREAQAARGHKLRGLRDWRPLLVPLLVGGMERAMNLAEAMAARGYGATADRRLSLRYQAGLLGGLLLGFSGWGLTFTDWARAGWLLLAIGAALFILMLRRLGRQSPHTRHRPRPWTRWDSAMVATALTPLALALIGGGALAWSPYPAITPPPFDVAAGMAMLLFVFPVIKR